MPLRHILFGTSVLVCVLILSGCRRQPSPEPHSQDGTEWMSWSSARREAFVRDFADGYLYGAINTCGGVDNLWRREFEPDDPAEKKLPSDIAVRCNSRIDGFSKFKLLPDRDSDASPYTDPITAFYTNHPEKRYLRIVPELMGLRDSTYDEAVRLDEQKGDAGK
jgi:hypothetical protein